MKYEIVDGLTPDMVTEARLAKMRRVLGNRQSDLTLVCENIHDPHNISAILRSCDAVGMEAVHLLYNVEKFPRLHQKTSGSGRKWVDQVKHQDPVEMAAQLKDRGFRLYATHLEVDAISIHNVDWTKPSAILMGNEHRGVSAELLAVADVNVSIPMFGMIQSLNVSVAAAVILFEACRQRLKAGFYPNLDRDEDWYDRKIRDWINR